MPLACRRDAKKKPVYCFRDWLSRFSKTTQVSSCYFFHSRNVQQTQSRQRICRAYRSARQPLLRGALLMRNCDSLTAALWLRLRRLLAAALRLLSLHLLFVILLLNSRPVSKKKKKKQSNASLFARRLSRAVGGGSGVADSAATTTLLTLTDCSYVAQVYLPKRSQSAATQSSISARKGVFVVWRALRVAYRLPSDCLLFFNANVLVPFANTNNWYVCFRLFVLWTSTSEPQCAHLVFSSRDSRNTHKYRAHSESNAVLRACQYGCGITGQKDWLSSCMLCLLSRSFSVSIVFELVCSFG